MLGCCTAITTALHAFLQQVASFLSRVGGKGVSPPGFSPTELRVVTLFKMAQAASGASAAARTPRAL